MVYLKKINETEKIEPDKGSGVPELIYLQSFKFEKRLDGNEKISFDTFQSKNLDDLVAGGIYEAYADFELTKLLVSFRLQNKVLKFDGGEEIARNRLFEISAVSSSDLLFNKKISFVYRNITFRNLLIRVIEQYRTFLPQILDDYSYIEDVDFVFPIFNKKNVTLGDVLQIFRNQGYQAFLRPDFKIQAGERTHLNKFNLDLDINAIDGYRGVVHRNNDTWLSKKYKEKPITSVIAKGGEAEEGTFTAANAITNKESNYDLLNSVNFEANFLFEPFNTGLLEGFETQNLTGVGWQKRYAIYNRPIQFNQYQLLETSVQILEHKEAYFLGIGAGNLYPVEKQLAAFYFQNQTLYVVQNQQLVPTTKTLKKFLDLQVLSISEDRLTVELASLEDLSVGDNVSIGGNNTGVTLGLGKVESINGNFVTLNVSVSEGDYNNTIRLFRVTNYELRILINEQKETEFLFRDGTGEFENLGTYPIVYPENQFVTAFNAREEPTYNVGNGVWEVGGYSIDYLFIDKANLLKAYDDQQKKIVLCSQEQAESVQVDAVINSIEKNGQSVGQIQFIAPSYTKLILPNKPLTTSRIPLSFGVDDTLNIGMRVLINDEARLISAFNQSLEDGFIDLDRPLDVLPSSLDQVWINTSIPANDTNFFIEYVPSRTIQIREDASDEDIDRLVYNQESVDLSEYTNVTDLSDRTALFIKEQVTPSIAGNFSFDVDFTNCLANGYYPLDSVPAVGEYITVKDSNQNIDNESARIEAIVLQSLLKADGGRFRMVVELGETQETKLTRAVLELQRGLGIVQDERSDTNYNLPKIKKDFLNFSESSFEIVATEGYPFYSGAYVSNYSGNTAQVLVTNDVSLTITPTEGFEFYSGAYVSNYSQGN